MYDAVETAILDARKSEPPVSKSGMIAIEAFDAADSDDEPVRVVGIISAEDGETLDFIVIRDIGGEMFPTVAGSVWPRTEPAADGTSNPKDN